MGFSLIDHGNALEVIKEVLHSLLLPFTPFASGLLFLLQFTFFLVYNLTENKISSFGANLVVTLKV